jgi:DNA-binding NarL/FixJ family response regulator
MHDPNPLTDREYEVLSLLAEGCCNKQIAYALGISLRTVEFHLTNVYTKLSVSSRSQAAIAAITILALGTPTQEISQN